jgi:hypothetical protein
MDNPDYYLRMADKCREMAETAEDELDRRLLRAMAEDFAAKARAAQRRQSEGDT